MRAAIITALCAYLAYLNPDGDRTLWIVVASLWALVVVAELAVWLYETFRA